MPAQYAWTVGYKAEDKYLITNAAERTISFNRKTGATATFTVRGEDPYVGQILEMVHDVKVYRNTGLFYRGRIGPSTDQNAETGAQSVQFQTSDYRGRLARRQMLDMDVLDWINEDIGSIVNSVVSIIQARPNGNEGITIGLGFNTGTVRDFSATPGQYADQVIDQVGNQTGGFDWEITPDLKINLYSPERGELRGAVLDYGGAFNTYSRQLLVDDYGNFARVSGGSDVDTQLISVANLADRPEGRWELSIGWPDSHSQEVHDDNALWMIRESSRKRYNYSLTLIPDWWLGTQTFWLGDWVRLRIKHGRLNVDELVRIEQLDFNLNDTGTERITVQAQTAVTSPPSP